MEAKSISDVTPPSAQPATSAQSIIPSDQVSQFSSNSDSETPPPDDFIVRSNRLTLDYVSSIVANPSKNLSTAAARSDFVSAVLGDVQLAKFAENDPPLLLQLETRLAVIIIKCTPIIQSPTHHFQVDALIAVFALVAARWPILVDAMERQGVIFTIVSAMRLWAYRPGLVARCMTALRVFSINDAARKRVMIDGGLNLTLDLMTRYQADPRIQMRAAAVIANVAFGCTHRKRRIARHGGVRKVIHAMKTFPENENIQLRGALTIRNLTHETQVNQFIAGNEGAVETISTSLLRFRSSAVNPELRFHCVMALESLCREDEGNRKRITDIENSGSPMPKSLSWDSSVGRKRSSISNEQVNEDGDIIVDEEEILLSHVTAKYRHGEALFPGRAQKGLDTSTSLSSSGCSDRHVLHDMGPKRKSDVVNSAGTTNNGRFETERGKEERGKASIIRAIVHSIRRDPDDELLVETALSLLTLISIQRPMVQLRIGEVGGIQVAIASMKRHSKNCGIISKASALVRGLCFQGTNRGQVTSGLVIMIAALREHRDNSETVREIVSALSNAVYEHEKNRSWVVDKGGVEAVVLCMEDAGNCDPMVLEAGICALRNFVEASESGALCAANEGAVRVTVSALEKTKAAKTTTERFVQEQCVMFMADIGRLAPQTKQEMLDLKVITAIEGTLGKLSVKGNADVHSCGNELLSILTQFRRSKSHETEMLVDRSGSSFHREVSQTPNSGKTFGRLFGMALARRTFVAVDRMREKHSRERDRPRERESESRACGLGYMMTPRLSRPSSSAAPPSSGRERFIRISGRLRKTSAVS